MRFNRLNIAVLAFGLLGVSLMVSTFMVPQANALKCAMSVLNEEAIEKADLIFQGKVLEAEKKKNTRPDDMQKMQDFVFSVDKLWKGHLESDHVTILANTYWGEPFAIGEKYLVVAHTEGKNYRTHECGNTSHIGSAGDKIEILKNKFGTQDKNDNIGEN